MTTTEKVMITGAAGLIGSHLAEKLLADGFEVYAFDVMNAEDSANLENCLSSPNFMYTKGDIREISDLENFFQQDASVLYHLASVVGVNRYMESPLDLIDIGVIGTRNLIKLCSENDVRMLFTSTSEVYGRNPEVPWSEDYDRVLGPTNVDRWSYSTSKALCEHMLFGMHHNNEWPMSNVRFFNVYGPRQDPIYVVSKSIYNVLNGKEPEIYDGGLATRCFCYIDDVIDGIISAATNDNAIGQVINLGNPVESSMKTVVELVLVEAKSNLEPVKVETLNRYGAVYEDIPRRIPNIDKAKDLLGWEPKTSLGDGIAKTISWAKENPWYLK